MPSTSAVITVLLTLNLSLICSTQKIEPLVFLKDLNNGHTLVGQKLVLECQTTFQLDHVYFEWETPGEPKQHILEFDHESSHFDVHQSEIKIYIRAHQTISATWLDNKNKTILNNTQYVAFLEPFSSSNKFNYVAKMQFKNFSDRDVGIYTVTASNEFGNKSFAIAVNSTKKSATETSVEELRDVVAFECVATAYPKSTPAWKVHPDGEYDMAYKRVGSDVSFHMFLDMTGVHGLHCSNSTAKYPEVKETYASAVISFDSNIQQEVIHVGFGQTVSISCAASFHSYVDKVKFFYNGSELNSGVKSLKKLDETLNQLEFKYMFGNQTGNYSCETLTRNGEIRSKIITVLPKHISSFAPNITLRPDIDGPVVEGQNVTATCEVSFYAPVLIECESPVHQINQYTLNSSIDESATYVSTNRVSIFGINSTANSIINCVVSANVAGRKRTIGEKYLWIFAFIPEYDAGTVIFNEQNISFDDNGLQIRVFLVAYPEPTITWYDNRGKRIPSHTSFIKQDDEFRNNYETSLTLVNLTLNTFGIYNVTAQHGNTTKSLFVAVNITKPSTVIRVTNNIMKCVSIGHPSPHLEWQFAECNVRTCLDIKSLQFRKRNESFETQALKISSYILLNSSDRFVYRCVTNNSFGITQADKAVYGLQTDFIISSTDSYEEDSIKNVDIVRGFSVGIICAVSSNKFQKEIQWLHNGREVNKRTIIEKTYDLVYSFASKIELHYSSIELGGYYTCNALTKDGLLKTLSVFVRTRDSNFFKIGETNMKNGSAEIGANESHSLFIYVSSFPKPVIKWLKNNQPLEPTQGIRFSADKQVLKILGMRVEDEGKYTCIVSNGFEKYNVTQALIMRDDFNWKLVAIPTVFAIVLLLTLAVVLFFYLKQQRELKSALNSVGLGDFKLGALDKLNPDLTLEDQADLLPYDRKWEIPMKNIRIGKQLGSGAFGVVLKAEIVDFSLDEYTKTVAVKTTQSNSGFDSVKALASELKIMTHIGNHTNVVNLEGACTTNITKQQLFVIVEFCNLGSLHDLLINYGPNFIDQKNYELDFFDWTIDTSEYVMINRKMNNYVNAQNPEVPPVICSKDLLNWAFQTARGMEYLSSRKVVHGDLATRNILVTDNNVVKISDFGLSKKIYQNADYVKKDGGRLPIKWLAIETIKKGIFSTQSDVWSFGVVLWEIFSLGDTPYPGMTFDENFYTKLSGGYRMDAPKAATKSLHNIMLECWNSDPRLRPSFTNLMAKIGSHIEEPDERNVVDVNSDYLDMNDKERPSEPRNFLNMIEKNGVDINSDYLEMNDKTQFEGMDYLSMKNCSSKE